MPRGVNTRWQGSEGPETSCQRQINLLFFNSRHHMYTSSAVLHNGHHVTSAIPETLILRCPPRFGYIYGSRNSLLAKSRSYQAGIFKIKSQHRLQKKKTHLHNPPPSDETSAQCTDKSDSCHPVWCFPKTPSHHPYQTITVLRSRARATRFPSVPSPP